MATLELFDVSDDLLRRLAEAAAVGGRGVAAEAVDRLDRSLGPALPARPHQELSALARSVRVAAPTAGLPPPPRGWLSPEYIRSARDWGRD